MVISVNTETTNDIIGGSAEAGEKDKNAQYNDQLLDDSHTSLNDISLDKDLNRNADNIMHDHVNCWYKRCFF
jgi:hypothetical protein